MAEQLRKSADHAEQQLHDEFISNDGMTIVKAIEGLERLGYSFWEAEITVKEWVAELEANSPSP